MFGHEKPTKHKSHHEPKAAEPVATPPDIALEELADMVEAEESGKETLRHQYKRTHPGWTCKACGKVETDPQMIGMRNCPGA